jgi:uncharacterized protein YfbU (UPF0304 family)
MDLTMVERLTLSYQLRILEKLYPDEAKSYAAHREAIERGYKLHYDWMTDWFSKDEMSPQDSKEVMDILDMYRAIRHSLRNVSDESLTKHHFAQFPGFDGNNEPQFGYARYLIEDLGKWGMFKENANTGFDGLNSHMPMMDTYRRMLRVWQSIESVDARVDMSADNLRKVLAASGRPA